MNKRGGTTTKVSDLLRWDDVDLLLASLGQHFVDERQDTSSGDCSADELIEFLISSDSELKMTGGNTLDAKILGSVTCHVSQLVLDAC